jgi:hypothetical protein
VGQPHLFEAFHEKHRAFINLSDCFGYLILVSPALPSSRRPPPATGLFFKKLTELLISTRRASEVNAYRGLSRQGEWRQTLTGGQEICDVVR